MMQRSDDPVRDYDSYDREREAELAKLPVCVYCGEPIQDEYYYDLDGDCVCEDCLKDNHRKSVDDYGE